ncbi:MAG: hypothetical protein GOVbin2700_42 [Prokaryotic dsDNA virus sp.]|jgi:hypothetical protein|nr:MAG: hypothetical protein GOVbin2700_42 [Prokaryotic dsDNA virus sp.]|tara:strand:+ start:858 stop:1238 length:381 start_codon:yes stop_codon:yes gene_type:complete
MGRKRQNPTLKKAMIQALEKTMGVVSTAATMAGINRSTHYEWLKTDSEYKQKVDDLENLMLDFAETNLHQQIQEGNTTATIFLLKTRGRKRGYIERQNIQVEADISTSKISPEARAKIDDILNDEY